VSSDVTALELKPGDGTMKVGAAVQLNLFARHKSGRSDLIPGTMATWSSSDNQIGDVNRLGRLTPRRAGALTITARHGDKQVSAVFTVID